MRQALKLCKKGLLINRIRGPYIKCSILLVIQKMVWVYAEIALQSFKLPIDLILFLLISFVASLDLTVYFILPFLLSLLEFPYSGFHVCLKFFVKYRHDLIFISACSCCCC